VSVGYCPTRGRSILVEFRSIERAGRRLIRPVVVGSRATCRSHVGPRVGIVSLRKPGPNVLSVRETLFQARAERVEPICRVVVHRFTLVHSVLPSWSKDRLPAAEPWRCSRQHSCGRRLSTAVRLTRGELCGFEHRRRVSGATLFLSYRNLTPMFYYPAVFPMRSL